MPPELKSDFEEGQVLDDGIEIDDENEDDSLRESLDAAIVDAGGLGGDDDDNDANGGADAGAADPPGGEPTGGDPEADPAKPADEHDQAAKEGKAGDGDDRGLKASPTDSTKAPVDWSPKQREMWSKVPRELQDKIHAREQEMTDAMANTSEARTTHERMGQLGTAFAQVMAAEGVNDPVIAAKGLFEVVAALRMGTPEQKARQIAGIISTYGIDIKALDKVLMGTASKRPNAMEQMIDQRMQPMNDLMAQMQGVADQNNQAQKAQVADDVTAFGTGAEFMKEVRMDMADLLDMAAKRNEPMTLQQAYDKACAINPEISEIIKTRTDQASLMAGNKHLRGKRRAASSLSGRRTGSGAGAADESTSMRSDLLAAMDEINDR